MLGHVRRASGYSEGRGTRSAGQKLGIDFVLLTGNPGVVSSTHPAIEQTLRRFKEAVGDSIVLAAGKMHAAGILSGGGGNINRTAQLCWRRPEPTSSSLLPATVPGIRGVPHPDHPPRH